MQAAPHVPRWISGGVGFCLLALSLFPVAAGPPSHVFHISVDGLGGTYLQLYLTNAPTQFSNFHRLQIEGACTFNARSDYTSTESVPNHCTIVTGRPVLQPANQPNTTHHGYDNNSPLVTDTIHRRGNTNVAYKASVFDVAHDHGLSTAFYSCKTRLSICARSYDATNGAPDTTGEDNGRSKIDFVLITNTAASNLVDVLITNLATAPHRYCFVHLNDADTIGHNSGWGSPAWSNAVRQIDYQLGRILTAITSSPVLSNRTAIVLSADHGGGGRLATTHYEEKYLPNYTIPLFVWGPGICADVDAYRLFVNRADPGTNRLDYDHSPQPLRDGDTANVALFLLGLPPIPGSSLRPAWASPNIVLAIARSPTTLTVSWPRVADAFLLESADTTIPVPEWRIVTNSLSLDESQVHLTVSNAASAQGQFFRLRRRDLTGPHPQPPLAP